MRISQKSAYQIYEYLIAVLGLGFTLNFIFSFSYRSDLLVVILLISLFLALLAAFPTILFKYEIFIGSIVVLGVAILWNPSTAAVAALIGSFVGAASSYFSKFRGNRIKKVFRIDKYLKTTFFQLGLLTIPLASVSSLLNWKAGLFDDQTLFFTRHNSILGFLLLYVVIHYILLFIDLRLGNSNQSLTLQQYSILFLLLELIPLPFIYLAVLSFSSLGVATLGILAGIPTVFSILFYDSTSTRARLVRRSQDLSMLSQISAVMRFTLDLDALLLSIQDQVTELLGVDNFYVALYNQADKTIWYPLAVKHGIQQEWQPRSLGNRLTDKVIKDRQPILLANEAHIGMKKIGAPIDDEKLEAWLGVPLYTQERVLGCLAVISFSPNIGFSEDDLNLLTTLSGQVSVALLNALLHEQTERRAHQLEMLNKVVSEISSSLVPEEVYKNISESLTAITNSSKNALFLVNEKAQKVRMAHSKGLSKQFKDQFKRFDIKFDQRSHSLQTRKPSLHPNLDDIPNPQYQKVLRKEKINAYVDIPLNTPSGQIGFISVYFEDVQIFPAEELEMLQIFASQAGLSITNAHQFARTGKALSRQAEQISILEMIGRKMSATLRSDKLFEFILDQALDYTTAQWGSVMVYNQSAESIDIKAQKGYDLSSTDIPTFSGISGKVIKTKVPLIVNDVSNNSDYLDLTNGKTKSQLTVPIIYEKDVLGVITLESPKLDNFSLEELNFISQLADQASIAVLNAELYESSQERLREQAALHMVNNRLVSNRDLTAVLNTIVQSFSAALESHYSGIYLWDEDQNIYTRQAEMRRGKGNNASLPEIIDLNSLAAQMGEQSIIITDSHPELNEILNICDGCQTLIFPLRFAGKSIGVVIAHIGADITLTKAGMNLPEAISAQSSIALQNALLYSDVKQGGERMEAVLDSVGEGVLMVNAREIVSLANTPIETFSKTPLEDIIGSRIYDLPEDVLDILGLTAAQAQELVSTRLQSNILAEIPKINYAFEDRFLERTIAPVQSAQNAVLGWVIVVRDITEEHQINESRELFTETLVHDLRSPIGAVKTTLQILREELEDETNPIITQSLDIADKSTRRVLGLVESLLNISQLESGNMVLRKEPTAISVLVENTAAELIPEANNSGIVLRNEVSNSLPEIIIDEGLIHRVLINLIDNALKFTPEGGQVTISAEENKDGFVTLHVADTGPGIPAEYRSKVFERFGQIPGTVGRRRGSGLGLTFCRLAVEAHNGAIWVNLPPNGSGTIISFSLPIEKQPEKSSA